MTTSALTLTVGGTTAAKKVAKVTTPLGFAAVGTAATGRSALRSITSALAFAATIQIPAVSYSVGGWDEEYASTELQWLRTCVKAHWDLTDNDVGIKGDSGHDFGRHRSARWLLSHGGTADYSIQDPRDRGSDLDVLAALDISLPTAQLIAACTALQAASTARTLPPQVAEWFGTVNGTTVAGWAVIHDGPATSYT